MGTNYEESKYLLIYQDMTKGKSLQIYSVNKIKPKVNFYRFFLQQVGGAKGHGSTAQLINLGLQYSSLSPLFTLVMDYITAIIQDEILWCMLCCGIHQLNNKEYSECMFNGDESREDEFGQNEDFLVPQFNKF